MLNHAGAEAPFGGFLVSAEQKKPDPARFSSARLAAVQALYSMDITGATPVQALDEYKARRENASELDKSMAKPDADLLTMLVHGTSAELDTIDEMIGGALSGEWTVDRIEAILRAILRVGIWELKTRQNTPARVAVSEYVDLARAFYAGTEPGLVNAVMDRMARILRPHEFDNGNGRNAG